MALPSSRWQTLSFCLLLLVCGGVRAELPPLYELEILERYPHDPQAFTQGLLVHDGKLLESTGLHGKSSLRRVTPVTGEVQKLHKLQSKYFGEGLTRVGERLVMLTYKAGVGLVFDAESFEPVDRFRYEGEGWGLAWSGEQLFMSDGSATLRLLDPEGFEQTGSLTVTLAGQPLAQINELEFIDGELWANVWPSDWVVSIDPGTGHVTRRINASALRQALPAGYRVDVLNGIAADPESDAIYMTGKLWPLLFKVRLRPAVGP